MPLRYWKHSSVRVRSNPYRSYLRVIKSLIEVTAMLSQKFKELRAKKNITQEDMAKLLNIKRQTYSAYERGVSFPDIVALTKIADFFEVSTDYLLCHKKATSEKQSVSDEMQILIDTYSDLSEEELKKVIEYVDFLKTKRI